MRISTQEVMCNIQLHLPPVEVDDAGKFGIDPIPSEYTATIADIDTDAFSYLSFKDQKDPDDLDFWQTWQQNTL